MHQHVPVQEAIACALHRLAFYRSGAFSLSLFFWCHDPVSTSKTPIKTVKLRSGGQMTSGQFGAISGAISWPVLIGQLGLSRLFESFCVVICGVICGRERSNFRLSYLFLMMWGGTTKDKRDAPFSPGAWFVQSSSSVNTVRLHRLHETSPLSRASSQTLIHTLSRPLCTRGGFFFFPFAFFRGSQPQKNKYVDSTFLT